MNKDLIFIDSDLALVQICAQLQGCSWLAVDTEFERVNTYYPELCLLQMAGNGMTVVIDTLAIANLEPLYDVLYAPSILKVFHAARQDLEIFFHSKGVVPVPLFDTQIAAAVLGHDQQIGYANLIKEILGVELAKTQTRTNWKRRPLSRSQIAYAADDVIYLAQAYKVLLAKLGASGQLSSLDEKFNALTRPEIYMPAPENMWLKIRAARNLEGNVLAVFQQLAAWREVTARAENLPRGWVLHDNTLVEMARLLPASREDLSRISGVHERVVERHGATLVEIIGRHAELQGSEQ
jgi:ribonuclease D